MQEKWSVREQGVEGKSREWQELVPDGDPDTLIWGVGQWKRFSTLIRAGPGNRA
jgi:hypothetical protein